MLASGGAVTVDGAEVGGGLEEYSKSGMMGGGGRQPLTFGGARMLGSRQGGGPNPPKY